MDTATLTFVSTFAPLAAFALGLVVFRRQPTLAAGVALLGALTSLVGTLLLYQRGPIPTPLLTRFVSTESVELSFGFVLDGPNLLMGVLVAAIAFLIQVYSLGYMASDPGKARYFSLLAFFTWSMLSFVYAANLLQMFVFWELVGLASFLLIGFWYEKPSAVAAAKKAFVMTRIGDVGLFVGIVVLLQTTQTLDISRIVAPNTIASIPPDRLTLIGLLLFCGVVGKSAQFPLHTWLPDAMEGPTPVSALLHSATMVAAGVFLFAKFQPLLVASTDVTTVVLAVAVFTAVLASTIAMVSRDIKKVLAYSSISQLGFMLVGLAAGSLYAGLFHLTTHAFFKALLFLCAGSYIHHVGSNDMVAIGRAGARSMRITTLGLIVGGSALAGIPPLAGFFSKETILARLADHGPPALLAGAYLAAFLTAYYTFRMMFLVTRPNPNGKLQPEHTTAGHGHGHDDAAHGTDAPWVMLVPILILVVPSLAAGLFGDTIGARLGFSVDAHPPVVEMLPAVGVTLFGVVLAWFEYGRTGASQLGFVNKLPALHRLFVHKWYLDDLYARSFGLLVNAVSRVAHLFDTRGIDGFTDGIGRQTIAYGHVTAAAQAGRLQLYVGTAVLLMTAFCLFLASA